MKYDAELACSPTGASCSSSSRRRFWSSGVGHRSLLMGNQHRVSFGSRSVVSLPRGLSLLYAGPDAWFLPRVFPSLYIPQV